MAQRLAAEKATAAAEVYPQRYIIAADTMVVLDGHMLGKPEDAQDAARMLRLLSGREHTVITGVCLRFGAREHRFAEETRVRFYPLRTETIDRYIATGEPMDKAGAYGVQGCGALLVESVAGDYCNVVGLPIARLIRELEVFYVPASGL
jgi:septum formation protein